MRILSRALGFGALLTVAPLATASAGSPSTQPYHHASEFGHLPVQPAGWSGNDDRRRSHWAPARPGARPGARSWSGHHGVPRGLPGGGWGQHWHDGRAGYRALCPLPARVVEHRLRRQSFQPVGRIVLRHGVYLVPALDPHGHRVLLAVDPATAVILGRQRRP